MKTRKAIIILMATIGISVQASPLIVAHRGASHDAPENTIPAFELAWQQGADAIEGDFHLTRDGEIVCIHDETTKNVAGKYLVVAESTLDELRQLDVGIRFWRRHKGTKIPTLAEVLKTVPKGKRIYLEIKCGPEILPKLFTEAKTAGLKPEQIVIISFGSEVVFHAKRAAPESKAFVLFDFKKDWLSGDIRPTAEDILRVLQKTNADGLSSEAHASIDGDFVRQFLDQGYEYHVWTIDDVKTARKFYEFGAMSITTNVPGLLKEKLFP